MKSIGLAVLTVAMAQMAGAALITAGTSSMVVDNGSTTSYSLSVYDGKAAYKPYGASSSTTLGDGTLLDYRFVTSITGSFVTYAQGSGNRIAAFTGPSANIAASASEDSWVKLWTANDPGVNYSTTPNYNDSQITHARANRAAGTIDISDLTQGKLYFVHGAFIGSNTFILTMSGAGQTDLKLTNNVPSPGTTNRGWITDFSFDNAGAAYDTISFSFASSDSVTRGRFMGVMLDAIPEPASDLMLIAGALGLGLLRKKLRRL